MGGGLSRSLGKEAGPALLASCMEGDTTAAHKLLQSNKRLAVWTNWTDGASPLHIAIVQGHTELCENILVAARSYLESTRKPKAAVRAMAIFVNMRSSLGQTPLEVACKFGHAEIVSLLLDNGGNALLQDTVHSRTCLHYAAIHGHAACIDILLADTTFATRAGKTMLLREACMVDGRQMHRYVDAPAALGFAPLHLAVGHGHRRATQALLQGGAKSDVRCKGHMFLTYAPPGRYKPHSTPLHIAAFSQNLPLCHAILSSQAQREDGIDLRSLEDGSGQRPHDLVDTYPHLAALLAPDAPLAAALETARIQLMAGGSRAPNSLAHLAANALRRALVGQLETIPARQRRSQALLQRPLNSVALSLEEGPKARWPSKEWPSYDEDEECEICFMHAVACDFSTCSHGVCKDCARALCGQHEDGNTPACPFCRSTIGGFSSHGRASQCFNRHSC